MCMHTHPTQHNANYGTVQQPAKQCQVAVAVVVAATYAAAQGQAAS